ncbi:MAG: UDP-N-acetylmuramoyl-L-alanine--D-glutamate ligase [Actinomycetes bacterium]
MDGLDINAAAAAQAQQQRAQWLGRRVTVVGLGIARYACADALVQRGADVTVLDEAAGPRQRERAAILELLGAHVTLGQPPVVDPSCELVVVSPGVPPASGVIVGAQADGITVWGELELAWALRGNDPAQWLCVSGTNGKTTTTLMLASMLAAAGKRTAAVGNVGESLVEAVTSGIPFDILAVEVSATQLPFVYSPSPLASACLNLAADHLDFFGSMDDYALAKAKVYERVQRACVYNVQDPATEAMVEAAEVVPGCRAVGFTLGIPQISMLGVVDDVLVDRAFVPNRSTHAQELANVSDVQPSAPHNVANALAAAALARAAGCSPAAVRDGLRSFTPAGHRTAHVATIGGVGFVDDSKATNGHAAATSVANYPSVVWIAGGQGKGQQFDDLVISVAPRLRAVVLLGQDRAVIAEALSRHAPEVPVVDVSTTDTGAMAEVVRAAVGFAQPGDTVLLAPGCASWDMFRDYAARGDAFASAVRSLETPLTG